MKREALVHFENARGPDHRGTFLACRKALGAIAIDINAGESFTVTIENGNLPVTMFAPLIAFEPGAFASNGVAADGLALRLLRASFLHVTLPLAVGIVVIKPDLGNYRKFGGAAQVTC
jgi:hypothetical protein